MPYRTFGFADQNLSGERNESAELNSWVDFCHQIMKRGVLIYAYANNHFQGHGPATIAKFLEL
jgi:hypothetical protein